MLELQALLQGRMLEGTGDSEVDAGVAADAAECSGDT